MIFFFEAIKEGACCQLRSGVKAGFRKVMSTIDFSFAVTL